MSPRAGGGGREEHLQQEGRVRQTVELRLRAHTAEPGGTHGVLVGRDQQGRNGMVRGRLAHCTGTGASYPSPGGCLTLRERQALQEPYRCVPGWGRAAARLTAVTGRERRTGVSEVHGFPCPRSAHLSVWSRGQGGFARCLPARKEYRHGKYLSNVMAI